MCIKKCDLVFDWKTLVVNSFDGSLQLSHCVVEACVLALYGLISVHGPYTIIAVYCLVIPLMACGARNDTLLNLNGQLACRQGPRTTLFVTFANLPL